MKSLKRAHPSTHLLAAALLTLALSATVIPASLAHAAGDDSAGASDSAKPNPWSNEPAPKRKSVKKSSKATRKAAKSKVAKGSVESAASAKKAKAGAETAAPGGKPKALSRDMVFDGSVVNGKYLSAGEGVSTVEDEKKLTNLIGMRADFKDRLTEQRAQLQAGSTGN